MEFKFQIQDSMTKIAVIGYGMVGKAVAYTFKVERKDCFDIEDTYSLEDIKSYGIFFICLPTPTTNGKQDLTAIYQWLKVISKVKKNAVVIIRSTILPGTTEKLIERYKLNIVFVPEFLTEATAIQDSKNPELLVVGSKDIILREKVRDLFRFNCLPVKIILCDATTAEFIKYSLNCFFALKVIYANELWDMAKEAGASYAEIKDVLESHKWGSKNHWDVWHKGYRGAGGKCLKKDLQALISKFNSPLLKTANQINEKLLGEIVK